MSNTMKTSLIILLCLISLTGYTQEAANPQADTIQWSYSEMHNTTNGDTLHFNGNFISYGTSGILWTQDGGRQYYFKVNAVEGSWEDISANGGVTYEVACDGVTGTLVISRISGIIKIAVDLGEPGQLTPHLLIAINTCSKV